MSDDQFYSVLDKLNIGKTQNPARLVGDVERINKLLIQHNFIKDIYSSPEANCGNFDSYIFLDINSISFLNFIKH